MRKIIQKIKTTGFKNVLIIGDIMLDEYIFGSVKRISPEAPVPVLKEESRDWSLGGAANVALNCQHIGCDVTLIGIVGNGDASGQRIISMMRSSGLKVDGIIKSSTRKTTNKKRVIAKSHQLLRVDLEDNNNLTEEERCSLNNCIDSMIKSDSIVIVSDYAKGVIDYKVMQRIIVKAQSCGCMVLVDPKGPDFGKYKGATYMKPNLKEFEEIVDFFGLSKDNSISQNGKQVCSILSLQGLIITMGEKGILFISNTYEELIPSVKIEVFDLTGAGDTVIAFLAVGLMNLLSIRDALRLASKAGAAAISHLKTYAVGLDELLDDSGQSDDKYYQNWENLRKELQIQQSNGRRIVFTNGCFDILHTGHIHILKEAKKHGDFLVVGLNTDASIKRFKGEGRPVKPLGERINVMSALGMVDFVVAFDEDTPLNLIKTIKPDVLAKGVDYKPEDVIGYKEVTEYGGEVITIGWKNQYSTTSLINKLPQNDKLSSL